MRPFLLAAVKSLAGLGASAKSALPELVRAIQAETFNLTVAEMDRPPARMFQTVGLAIGGSGSGARVPAGTRIGMRLLKFSELMNSTGANARDAQRWVADMPQPTSIYEFSSNRQNALGISVSFDNDGRVKGKYYVTYTYTPPTLLERLRAWVGISGATCLRQLDSLSNPSPVGLVKRLWANR